MCEWLSHSDWCDVRLVCGGRTFNAHRAVLASVSRFLRQILLSCPANESPTFIVLPDFDLDAMSSVLYYIYNGEVVVQNDKLDMFLDIIKTMQIFIDNRYLPNESDKVEFEYLHCKRSLDKINIFKLGHLDYEDQPYVNIKKGKADNLQCSQSLSDCSDRTVRRQNLSEKRQAALGNLKSPFGDRQSNSFLRDLFIETYPRNGNVNGLAAGVLAISNECYQAPASALLTNANVKHLGADDSLSKPYKKTVEHIKHSPSVLHPHKPRCPDDQPDNQEINQLYDPAQNICSMNFENINKHDSNKVNLRSANVWLDHVPMQTDSLCRLRLQEQILTRFYVPSLDINVSPPMLEAMKSLQNIRSPGLGTTNERSKEKQKLETVTKSTTILNQVMRNPWCPRIPINYKPFRRKVDATKSSSINQRELSDITHNDSNNNVPDIVKDEITTPKEESTVAMVLPAINGKEDFKCTVCKQVFTNDDTLSAHMRRHTSNARYTCGECGKTFSQLRNFKYHMSIHRGTREFAATCSVCGKYFNDRGYLSSHMKIHRNRKEYKCNQCPKSFNQRVAYNMHVRIHTGVKPHVCEECGKAFSRKMLLKQHQRTHSGERPYACPHCDKRFADRSNMTLHLRLHTGVKPFSCTLCPKSFTKKHHLKSHLNFHTGSKPYSCPRCNLAFTQSSNMRTHMKKCNASEPLSECPQINNVLKST